jgi:hypothetical protein
VASLVETSFEDISSAVLGTTATINQPTASSNLLSNNLIVIGGGLNFPQPSSSNVVFKNEESKSIGTSISLLTQTGSQNIPNLCN